VLMIVGVLLSSGCSRDFLNPDPLSFYEPNTTFRTRSGIEATLAICDRHLKLYWTTDHNEMLSLGTEYIFSELMVAGATGQRNMCTAIAKMITPTNDDGTHQDLNRTHRLG